MTLQIEYFFAKSASIQQNADSQTGVPPVIGNSSVRVSIAPKDDMEKLSQVYPPRMFSTFCFCETLYAWPPIQMRKHTIFHVSDLTIAQA